jgi:hypothetical protein
MSLPTLESFLKDVETHELTVNLDQGVFRDLTISRPNTSSYHYNITTRSGYLIITGDMGSFVFQRLTDMFDFFRSDSKGYRINDGHWEEKLEAVCRRGGAKSFSSERVEEVLLEELNQFKQDLSCSVSDKRKFNSAKEEIDRLISIASDSEYDFYAEVSNWDSDSAGGMRLDDWWEWDFREYTYHYIWCLYAIVHAIKLYDAYKAKGECCSAEED